MFSLFFQFFPFSFPLFNSFFSRNQYKTCWYTWSKLNWSFDFVFLSEKCWVYCIKSSSWNRHILIVILKGQQMIILLLAINYLQRKLVSVMLSLWLLLFNEDWFQCVWQSVHCSEFRVCYTPQILKQLLVNNNWVLFMYMGKLIQLVLCCLLQIAWIILYH